MEYMNNQEICICCYSKPELKESMILVNKVTKMLEVPLEKHHVRYFPEIIAYVHDHCHEDIHSEPSKYPALIQYLDGDSRKFYNEKKEIKMNEEKQ